MSYVGKVGELVLPRISCHILLQHVWQTAYNRSLRVQQIIVRVCFRACIESALDEGLLYLVIVIGSI
jgi:hypothetical protein